MGRKVKVILFVGNIALRLLREREDNDGKKRERSNIQVYI